MNLYNAQNLGLIQRIWKRCGATINTYSIKNIVSDINDALDWYFSLAFKSGAGWEFDDINKTLPPIDTQNIVSGTNRYKVSAFTEKIINLIKLEVLDGDADGHTLVSETFDDISDSFEERYLNTTNNTGVPTHYCKYGDFIYLYPTPNYSETSGLKAYFNRPASKFEFVSCSTANGASALTTAVGHGLVAGDQIMFETQGTLNTGLTADAVYYVIATGLTNDVFQVSTSLGGAAVTTSSTGTNNFFIKLNGTPGIMLTHQPYLVTYTSRTWLNDNNQKLLGLLPAEVQMAERKIEEDYSLRTKDDKPVILPKVEDNR